MTYPQRNCTSGKVQRRYVARMFPVLLLVGCVQPDDINDSPQVETVDTIVAPQDQGPAKATLDIRWKSKELVGKVVILTLRNEGSRPIIVDRDLVWCVNIAGTTSEGDPIPFKGIDDSQQDHIDLKEARKRLVTLQRGGAVEREIHLEKGFKSLDTAQATDELGRHFIQGWTCMILASSVARSRRCWRLRGPNKTFVLTIHRFAQDAPTDYGCG